MTTTDTPNIVPPRDHALAGSGAARHTGSAGLPTPRHALTLGAARVLLALLGIVVMAGAIYFGFFASEEDGGVANAFDAFLGVWGFANGAGFLAASVLLGRRRPEHFRLARWLIVAHLAFSAIKILGFDETEVFGIVIADLVALALLRDRARTR